VRGLPSLIGLLCVLCVSSEPPCHERCCVRAGVKPDFLCGPSVFAL
jgi:hypothetical protein